MKWTLLIVSVCWLCRCFCGQPYITLRQAVEIQENKLRRSPHDVYVLTVLVDSYNLNSQYVSSERAIRDFEKSADPKDLNTWGLIYLAYAKTYKYENKNDKAIYYFLRAEESFRKLKDFKGLAACGVELIEFNRRLANYQEAEKQYYKFAFLAKKHLVNDPKIWNGLYNRFAAVLNETARPHASIRFSKKALELAGKTADFNATAISYNEIGFSFKNLLKVDQAIESYLNAENAWMKMGYYRDAIQAKLNRLLVASHNNRLTHKERLAEYNGILKTIDSFHVDCPKSSIYQEMATAHYMMGNFESAYESLSDFHGHNMHELELKMNSEINNIKEKYQNDRLAHENEKAVSRAKEKQRQLSIANDRVIGIIIVLIIVVLVLAGLFYLWRKLKIANRLLLKRNEQKTILVQEIHHRVKNNLQFVRSIIEMQSALNDSGDSLDNLKDVSRRIDAMSLVHEMLYIEEEGMGISVQKYLEKLVYLSQTMFDQSIPMQFNVDVENFEFPVDKVVSIGIICSELITNSVKHAYKGEDDPKFSISLRKIGLDYHFEVSDNGSEKELPNTSERFGLGMRLIDIFSRQLNGTYQISRVNGYKYSLIFQL